VSTTQTAKAAGLLSTIPRKVVILAAEPMQADGTFAEFEKGMYLGGHTRMEAAVHVAKLIPSTEFIIVGGYNRPGEGDPKTSNKVNSMAAFMRAHIREPHLELVYSLPCTHHNFIALYHYLQITGQRPEEIGLLTSTWQIVRAMEFASQAAQLFQHIDPIRFTIFPAEQILNTTVEAVVGDRMPEYDKRMASERRGLGQIIDETYEDSCIKYSPAIIQHVNLALI
jgi:hypothetical protein